MMLVRLKPPKVIAIRTVAALTLALLATPLLSSVAGAGPLARLLEGRQGRYLLAELGFDRAASRRILNDAALIARLETEPQFATFREGLSRFMEMAETERDLTRFSLWTLSQSEGFRHAIHDALSAGGQAWRSNSGRLLFSQNPQSLGPTSQPGRLAIDSFWEQSQNLRLTFSFDSEIDDREVVRLLLSHDGTREQARALFRPIEVPQGTLIAALGLRSEAQLRSFALRRSARPVGAPGDTTNYYRLDDLFPSGIAQVISNYDSLQGIRNLADQDSIDIRRELRILTELLFSEQGLRVSSHLDGNVIELTHASFEIAPRQFHSQIEILHSLVGLPCTHLHVGIPVSLRSRDDLISIGQAVEAPIVLRLLLQTETRQGEFLTYLRGSTFLSHLAEDFGGRGLVRLTPSRFPAPVVAHDLEVRQWSNIEEGLGSISLASRLSLDPRQLWHWSAPRTLPRLDARAGDIRGALAYLSALFSRSERLEYREIGRRLLDSVTQLDLPRAWNTLNDNPNAPVRFSINQALRSQIASEVRTLRVLETLEDLNLYYQ